MADELSPGLKIGVAVYAEAEWERLRQLAADSEMLEETSSVSSFPPILEGLTTEPVPVRDQSVCGSHPDNCYRRATGPA